MADSKITGADEVLRKLRELSPKLQKKALNAAMRKGMTIVKKSAVSAAKRFDDPATAASIPKAIAIRSNPKRARRMGPGTFLVQVGVEGGAKAGNVQTFRDNKTNRKKGVAGLSYDVWYWRLIELGTSKMRAQPFLRPALADNVDAVTNTVAAELDKAIDKIVASGAA